MVDRPLLSILCHVVHLLVHNQQFQHTQLFIPLGRIHAGRLARRSMGGIVIFCGMPKVCLSKGHYSGLSIYLSPLVAGFE